jgi:hypothetical protein
MTNEEIQKLKAAGIDDATIQSIAAEDAAKQVPSAMQTQGPVAPEALPEVDVTKPSETLRNAQAAGVPTTNPGSWMTDALAIGQGLMPSGVGDTLMKLGEGALAYQGIKGWRENSAARASQAAAELAREQGIQQRAAQKAAQQAAQQAAQGVRPVVPTAMPTAAATGVSPVAPQAMPPAQAPMQQPSMMQRGMDMANKVRQAAAQRITNLPAMGEMLPAAGEALSGAARFAGRALGPASLALQTTDLGPKTPQVGRMRGMEINPLTGAPWTPDQIKQYEANSMMFDQQFAQPQMRR